MTKDGHTTVKAFCNGCCGDTNHLCQPIHTRNFIEGNGEHRRPFQESWTLLVCCGCDSVHIERATSSPDGQASRTEDFPPRQARRRPSWQSDLPQEIRDMHREIYDALQAKAPCCATMGVRAIIDMALTQVVGYKGTFPEKLAAVVQAGHLASAEKTTLEAAIEAGNAAAHRGFIPNEQQIEDVLGIVEHLLMGRYVLGQAATRLRSQVPGRTR